MRRCGCASQLCAVHTTLVKRGQAVAHSPIPEIRVCPALWRMREVNPGMPSPVVVQPPTDLSAGVSPGSVESVRAASPIFKIRFLDRDFGGHAACASLGSAATPSSLGVSPARILLQLGLVQLVAAMRARA